MSIVTKTKIIDSTINLGKVPYFKIDDKDNLVEEQHGEHKLRVLEYHTNNTVNQFPLISNSDRLKECMEFNLYLIDRYTGNFSLSKNKHTSSDEYVWTQGS